MADRKWRSDFRFGGSTRGAKMCLLLKIGNDISSRFGDTGRNFEFSRWRQAAILDFFEKQNYTCPLIFPALSNAANHLSLGGLGAEIWRGYFLPFVCTEVTNRRIGSSKCGNRSRDICWQTSPHSACSKSRVLRPRDRRLVALACVFWHRGRCLIDVGRFELGCVSIRHELT